MKAGLLVLAALLVWGGAQAAGTTVTQQFYSIALQENRWVQVYLPEGYDPGGTTLYPAIYFLHGANGNHSTYPELISYLNSLIESGQIAPVIAVKPDGSGCSWPPYWEGCGWVDSELQGDYETYLVEDVIGFAEQNFRIRPDPAARAIMGHSMGAFGAMHAGLKHPEMFAAIAALSGYPDFEEMRNQHVPLILSEQQSAHGDPPWIYTPQSLFTGAWFMFAGGFSPNSDAPPYSVDFPLDPYGDIIPDVWARWLEHDPAALANALTPDSAPAIYFDCGTGDSFYLYPINQAFDAHLTALGIPHGFQSFAGGHWVPSRIGVALRFIDSALSEISATDEGGGALLEDGIVRLAVINPSMGDCVVRFTTDRAGPAVLEAFDVQGRRIATVLDGTLGAGAHEVTWDTDGVPAGFYLVRLQAAGYRETRSVVVR